VLVVTGVSLPSGIAAYNLEEPSGIKFCVGGILKNVESWLCTQVRWSPEVVNIFGAAARYRRAAAGSSHDDAHPDNSTLHKGKIYSFALDISRFVIFVLRQLRAAAAATWAPRLSTCKNQRAAPRASA
jgi:hypothetical protein